MRIFRHNCCFRNLAVRKY
nr:unnamed protein product [Callosobruchus chinensis]